MRLAAALFVAALVSGCATAPRETPQPAPAPAPSTGKYYMDDGPPDQIPPNLADIPNAVPRDEPFHRSANRPYTAFGRTYVPILNKDPSKERGPASWYGRKFHGNKTSSGETYDMFAMTAAHPTFPIPSYARVTNLNSGDWVVVRINDRGPFLSNRIIDLSYAAAARIGIVRQGSGLVEVQRVFEVQEPEVIASQTAPPTLARIQTPILIEEPAGLWLQLGAFSSRQGAEAFRDKVKKDLTWLYEPVDVMSRDGLHRVRLGPYRSRDEASAIADKLRQTLGIPAMIVR